MKIATSKSVSEETTYVDQREVFVLASLTHRFTIFTGFLMAGGCFRYECRNFKSCDYG